MEAPRVTPEILDLLERSTAIPDGLAFVHDGPIDSVAVTLGVHPGLIVQACDCLDHAEQRAMLVRHFERALERRRTSFLPTSGLAPSPTTASELIEAAERQQGGVAFLVNAPFETAAILFAVHPFLVLEAREQLTARGFLPDD